MTTDSAEVRELSTGQDARHPIGNIEFIKTLAQVLLALAISALLLAGAYTNLVAASADSGEEVEALRIAAKDLVVRIGKGTMTAQESLSLNTLVKDGQNAKNRGEGRALLTSALRLQANDYPFVSYDIAGHHPGEVAYLIWRTADNPREIFSTRLYWSGDESATFHLAKHPKWRGQITEVGIDIYGDLRGQALAISALEFLPSGPGAIASTVLSEWAAFRQWSQRSTNHLRGTPAHSLLAPTPAMAIWSALAVAILFVGYTVVRSHSLLGYTLAVFIPWISLDLLWQQNLSTQLADTHYNFSEKSQHQKHLADVESVLYQYASHLKNNVLPEPGARIFLLEDTEHMTYNRLKIQYYLLPHNVFNYDRFPRKRNVKNGDFILVMGKIRGLEFSPSTNTLKWDGESLKVRQLDTSPLGDLYKVQVKVKARRT